MHGPRGSPDAPARRREPGPPAGPPPASGRALGRGVYVAVGVLYALLFLAVVWPIYPLFARIDPRILGMPLSMAYVVAALVTSFAILLGLYLREGAGRGVEPDPGPEGDPAPGDPGALRRDGA